MKKKGDILSGFNKYMKIRKQCIKPIYHVGAFDLILHLKVKKKNLVH
jgi:hypothetical protein